MSLSWADHPLIRAHAETPMHVNIFGYFYNIDTAELIEVAQDRVEVFRFDREWNQ